MSSVVIAVGLCSWGALVSAQDPSSEVIKNRIAEFRKIGKAFKHIRDELRAQNPSLPLIRESAEQIESLGGQIRSWFPPGSDQGNTHAREMVWTERAKFEEAQKKFYAEAQKMAQLAQSDDKAVLLPQYRALGEACKSCHDSFRGKVEDTL